MAQIPGAPFCATHVIVKRCVLLFLPYENSLHREFALYRMVFLMDVINNTKNFVETWIVHILQPFFKIWGKLFLWVWEVNIRRVCWIRLRICLPINGWIEVPRDSASITKGQWPFLFYMPAESSILELKVHLASIDLLHVCLFSENNCFSDFSYKCN